MPTLQRDYGDIVTMRYYNFRVYFVSHPDYIEQVLVTDNRKYIKGRILRKNKQLFGNGLLTSEGDFWLRQRRLAQPAFHRGRVARYADTMVRYASRMASEWSNGEERDIHAEMMRLTLSIVAKTLFDVQYAVTSKYATITLKKKTTTWPPHRGNNNRALETKQEKRKTPPRKKSSS